MEDKRNGRRRRSNLFRRDLFIFFLELAWWDVKNEFASYITFLRLVQIIPANFLLLSKKKYSF